MGEVSTGRLPINDGKDAHVWIYAADILIKPALSRARKRTGVCIVPQLRSQ